MQSKDRAYSSSCHPTESLVVAQNLGTDWDERVLPSIGNEIVKAVVAQYNAEQLLTQRDKVSRAVRCAPVPSARTLNMLSCQVG